MTNYRVQAQYFRPSGTETVVEVEVEADTAQRAVAKAKNILASNPARKISSWGSFHVVATEEPTPELTILAGHSYKDRRTGRKLRVLAKFANSVGVPLVAVEVVDRNEGNARVLPLAVFEQMILPRETVEFWSVYPTGNVYLNAGGPVRNSSYDLADIVQLKITKVDGKIVKKEFVE